MFGLDQYSRRYSVSNNLRGNKLSLNEMNRTHSLKFRKVKEIQTARTHLPDFDHQPYKFVAQISEPYHSKVLKRTATPLHRASTPVNNLMIESNRQQHGKQMQVQEIAENKKDKIYFYSANLDQNMNLYMNRMLNRSEHDRKQKIRQIEQKINLTYLDKISTSKNQNQFWRKMRRSISRKESSKPQEQNRKGTNQPMWQHLIQ